MGERCEDRPTFSPQFVDRLAQELDVSREQVRRSLANLLQRGLIAPANREEGR